MARDESWEMAGPDEAALAQMKKHCHRDHKVAFEPKLHLSYANHCRHEARITYLPGNDEEGKYPSFECLLCDPPQRFLLGLVFDFSNRGTRERWLRENPALADEIAEAEVPGELIGTAIEAYVHGELGAGGFAQWGQAQKMRTLAKRRPKDAMRADGCKRFLLEQRLDGSTVEQAINALLTLQAEDPAAWEKLSGGTRTITEPTLRRYWTHIPRPVRDAAGAAAADDGGTTSEVKERLLAKLSPSNDLPPVPKTGQARPNETKPLLPPPGALKDRGGPRARGQR
jgi:hypothetical protein